MFREVGRKPGERGIIDSKDEEYFKKERVGDESEVLKSLISLEMHLLGSSMAVLYVAYLRIQGNDLSTQLIVS